MRTLIPFSLLLIATLPLASPLRAELLPILKQTVERFDETMNGYEATRDAIIKNDRDGYVLVLGEMRKRSERAKRPDAVAAIDSELKALKAGPLTGDAPPGLPQQLLMYRDRYISAPERAAKAIESVQRQSRVQHLKWLDDMTVNARIGKDAVLEAAIADERKRVLASDPKAPKSEEPAKKAAAGEPAGKEPGC